jgi:hypothetical protein
LYKQADEDEERAKQKRREDSKINTIKKGTAMGRKRDR